MKMCYLKPTPEAGNYRFLNQILDLNQGFDSESGSYGHGSYRRKTSLWGKNHLLIARHNILINIILLFPRRIWPKINL